LIRNRQQSFYFKKDVSMAVKPTFLAQTPQPIKIDLLQKNVLLFQRNDLAIHLPDMPDFY
jgi:hypothetical protein